jgi:4-diphosphocytidyl-2-C-methyl-D-erythritol kinase
VFADVGDRIEVTPAERLGLTVSGPFAAHAPGDERDLAWRAAAAFFESAGLCRGVAIEVEKNIPAGAGFGGGSSDAAAVLLLLEELFEANLTAEELHAIALKLGADVPMCLTGRALRAGGIGEVIEPLNDWPPLPLVLVWPGQTVSTAEVFNSLVRRDNPPLEAPPRGLTPRQLAAWLARCHNDLEAPAQKIAAPIGAALEALRTTEGCLLARMSGSGSGCFGLFETAGEACGAAALLGNGHPGWWTMAASAR